MIFCRLYSSAVYNDEFEEHSKPEIVLRPVDEVVLRLKTMSCERVAIFPFPTPPDSVQIGKAEERLTFLGALEQYSKAGGLYFQASILTTGKIRRFSFIFIPCRGASAHEGDQAGYSDGKIHGGAAFR